ncbi:hypothetical protein BT96DRAFT_1023743 [Gymnopus androsaceus JB14]|uniref:Uncharacterized protein n=1 Tax=Gymnopus androsaceus JB14 TaxID=1447944 RepID=A0A6A4H1P4_9AGAR|nr:hypothetical protein BT96DRAFT_1023743 [Gymnopus androsaceus JB14]
MPETLVKGIFDTSELHKAMTEGFKNSIRHHPSTVSAATCRAHLGSLEATDSKVGRSRSRHSDILFSQIAVKAIETSIETLIAHLAIDETKKSIKLRVTSFFVHVGREDAAFSCENIKPMLHLYMEEFSHIFQRCSPVPDDFDGSPQSAIRRTEGFRIPAFRRETPSQTDGAALVVRRSQRLASRPVKASSTAGRQAFSFRKIGEIPVTPTKGRKKATQDALEHPTKRRRLADVSNFLTPSQSISTVLPSQKPANDESISAAPLKTRKQRARERVKRLFGVVDENAVSNGTRSRSKA